MIGTCDVVEPDGGGGGNFDLGLGRVVEIGDKRSIAGENPHIP